jgi:hypothetical protein
MIARAIPARLADEIRSAAAGASRHRRRGRGCSDPAPPARDLDIDLDGLRDPTVPQHLGVLAARAFGHGLSFPVLVSVTPVLRHQPPFR